MIYFGIPSYQRSEKQLTLEYLESVGVKPEQIVMSVQTEEDYEKYRQYENRVGKLIYRPAHNVSGNTNTIFAAVPKNERIVILDDDIKYISVLRGGKLVPIDTEKEFSDLFRFGYMIASKLRTIGFSVYPVHNEYFMSNSYHTVHIGEGTLLALTNVGIRFDETLDTKSDFETTCRVIRAFGAYPRLNFVSCKAGHYTSGGCDWNWKDPQRVAGDAETLVAIYPDLVRSNPKRPGEVLMQRIGKKVNIAEGVWTR